MKMIGNKAVIGVDHGYGNIKTAGHCFPNGILCYEEEPPFTRDLLTYEGKYYLIGEGHKEFAAEKTKDSDYYLLTLAAVAMELRDAGLKTADVILAAGLPLTWTAGQKKDFADYLAQKDTVSFTFQKEHYRIRISGVRIYPQGYAAVAAEASAMKGLSLVADIGNGTMNTLYLVNGRPQSGRMYTEKFGTYQCTLAVRELFMEKTHRELHDAILEEVLCRGTADIPESDLKIIREAAADYVSDIFRRLREHGYDEKTMTLYVTGGGSCLVKNFYSGDFGRIRLSGDICAAAKGYEYLAALQLRAEGLS